MERLSMNTSLKNARIFDEDSWDEDNYLESYNHENENGEESKCKSNISIKRDPDEDSKKCDVIIKKEIKEECSVVKIKKEIREEFTDIKVKVETTDDIKHNVKKEEESDEISEFDMDIHNTPVKVERSNIDNTNPSPFTKDLFTNFIIESPGGGIKDNAQHSCQEGYKSFKKTVFTRHSPYKRDIPDYLLNRDERISVKDRLGDKSRDEDDGEKQNRLPVKKRLGPIVEQCEIPKKKFVAREKEKDPTILARRQKQIDYGRNTICYDNYLRKVPREERTSEDPQTPNMHTKYSRRAWDGLIKQWRLKLHKYDE